MKQVGKRVSNINSVYYVRFIEGRHQQSRWIAIDSKLKNEHGYYALVVELFKNYNDSSLLQKPNKIIPRDIYNEQCRRRSKKLTKS